jgi:hypothetical protein
LLLEVCLHPLVTGTAQERRQQPDDRKQHGQRRRRDQRAEHTACHRCVPQLTIDVGPEGGVELGERPAAQRGAEPLEVTGSDPQLVGPPLTG